MVDRPTSVANPIALRASAWLGFAGVALGAFGAHALRGVLAERNTVAVWDKAVLYHLIHALVMLWVAGRQPFSSFAWKLFGAGVLCFSGSLYVWALTGTRWLVFVTPLGGLSFLAGWLALALHAGKLGPQTPGDASP